MKTEELINFYTVCKYQSFNKAASELFISRQALQRSINSLESELNKKLFSRGSTGVELTDFGQLFYERALPVVNDLNALLKLPEEFDKTEKNHITLGIRGNFGSAYVIRKIVKEFESLHPDTTIEVLSLENTEIESLIVEGSIDFAYSILPTTLSGITSEELLQIELCLVLNESHPLAKYEKVPGHKLNGYDYMIQSFSHHTANLFTSYAKANKANVNIVFTTADANLVYSTVLQENLIGVSITRDAWMGEALYEGITKREFDPPLALHQGIIYKEGRKFSKTQRQFLDYFKRKYRDANYLHKTQKDKDK